MMTTASCNTFLNSLLMFPLLFVTPKAFYCYKLYQTERNSDDDFTDLQIFVLFASFVVMVGFCLVHVYVIQKDYAKITIEKFKLHRQ